MILSQSKYRTWFASTVCGRPTTSKLQKFICQKAIIFSICGSNPYDFNTVGIYNLLLFYDFGGYHNN